MSKITIQELEAFLDEQFPQARRLPLAIDELGDGLCRATYRIGERQLRPGGTVSGPTLMILADTIMFFTVMTRIGLCAQTVTSHLSIDFMRRPTANDIAAECRLLKLGRSLAVGHVLMATVGESEPVAQASVTYAVPPRDEPAL